MAVDEPRVVAEQPGARAARRSGAGSTHLAVRAEAAERLVAGALDRRAQPLGRPDALHGHLVLGQRPGLVRADHGRLAERLDRRQPPHERVAPRHPLRRERERERHGRQQPLGDVRDRHADREHEASVRPMPGAPATTKNSAPIATASTRHEPRHVVELALERAALAPGLLCELGDPAESVAMPVAVTSASAVPAVDVRAGEDVLLGRDRARLAGQRRLVDAQLAARRAGRRPRRCDRPARAAARRRERPPRRRSRPSPRRAAPGHAAAASCCSASTARSARYSWTNAKTALTRMTTTIATLSSGMPATRASAAPAHSSSAKSSTKFARNWRTWDGPLASAIAFGPCCASSRSASSVERPAAG